MKGRLHVFTRSPMLVAAALSIWLGVATNAVAAQFTCLVPDPGRGNREIQVEAPTVGSAYCAHVEPKRNCTDAKRASTSYGSAKCWATSTGPSLFQSAQRTAPGPQPRTPAERQAEARENVARMARASQTGTCAEQARLCVAACGSARTPADAMRVAQCKQPCDVRRAQCGLQAAEAGRLSGR